MAGFLPGRVKLLDDISRLKHEYEDRRQRLAGSDVYSWFNQANLYALHQRQRAALSVLKQHGFSHLENVSVFEMGCGGGGVLTEFLGFGAAPEKLCGVDLLFERLCHAHHMLPISGIANADGQSLPFPTQTFDLVLQFTAVSSILDSEIRQNTCTEMMRVLKPGGIILWYDFWLNPTNPQTRGIRPAEIRRLFSNCRFEFHRVTLAPPIARRLAPLSWLLSMFLERLKVFNTHYLAVIQPV